MRRALTLMALLCLAAACNDDADSLASSDASTPTDASMANDGAIQGDGATPNDAGVDGATPRSLLPRPGTLERPPTALPDELKPPR